MEEFTIWEVAGRPESRRACLMTSPQCSPPNTSDTLQAAYAAAAEALMFRSVNVIFPAEPVQIHGTRVINVETSRLSLIWMWHFAFYHFAFASINFCILRTFEYLQGSTIIWVCLV